MISTFVLVHFRITRRSVRALGLHCPTYKHPAVDLARCNLLFRKHSLSQLTADATLPRTLSGKIIQPKCLGKPIEWLSSPCKLCYVHLTRDTKRSIYLALVRSAHLDYPIEVWSWQKRQWNSNGWRCSKENRQRNFLFELIKPSARKRL